MPTIAFASPKGGAGKTTTAALFSCAAAENGATVKILDCDPNKNITEWASRPGCPENISVVSDITEESIVDSIESAETQAQLVVIDLEGTASLMVSYAISMADLVVIPLQASHLDARQAARAVTLIKNQEKTNRRRIPYGIVFTRTSPAIITRSSKAIRAELIENGVDLFKTEIIDREAFRAMFSFGGSVTQLTPKQAASADKASKNALAFSEEIVERLRALKSKRAEVA